MPETSIQTPPGFNQLPKAEQVRYLQALWDQISANPDEVPVPESHLQLAEERLRRYRENPAIVTPRIRCNRPLGPEIYVIRYGICSKPNSFPRKVNC